MNNTEFQLLPDQASTIAPEVDALFWFICGVSIFFTLLIAVLLLVFAIRYRRVSEDHFPTPVVGSTALELTWSIIPLIISMGMFGWGVMVYFEYYRTPDNAMEVYVIGKQWMWHVQHPSGPKEINTLHVPVGTPVKLIMTSEDVIHDFSIPAFRVKRDAVPGKFTYLWFEATKTGTFHLFCVLYCGTDHSRMVGKVVVMEKFEYERWLAGEERKLEKEGGASWSLAAQGGQLFQKLQCITCHHRDAGNRAPSLEGIFGQTVTLEDGRDWVADEEYLRESILFPSRKIRAGWKDIMPPYAGQVSEKELIRVVAYLKSLRHGDTPPLVQKSDPPAKKEKK
jgi:cytochrome c oxidase subunit 2